MANEPDNTETTSNLSKDLMRQLRPQHLGSNAGRNRRKGAVKYAKSTLRGGARNFGSKRG